MKDKIFLLVFPMIVMVILTMYLSYYAYHWKSPTINEGYKISAYECIYNSKGARIQFEYNDKLLKYIPFLNISVFSDKYDDFGEYFNKFSFPIKGGKELKVSFMKNASIDCINPYFPVIHIITNAPHNAWLQIVYTDCKDWHLARFIDTVNTPEDDVYPFYSFAQDFYDNPIWTYSLFSKPLSMWKARAYPVLVDRKNKTIKFIGGVGWGFHLPDKVSLVLRPEAIMPTSLNYKSWLVDWEIFATKLPGYRLVK